MSRLRLARAQPNPDRLGSIQVRLGSAPFGSARPGLARLGFARCAGPECGLWPCEVRERKRLIISPSAWFPRGGGSQKFSGSGRPPSTYSVCRQSDHGPAPTPEYSHPTSQPPLTTQPGGNMFSCPASARLGQARPDPARLGSARLRSVWARPGPARLGFVWLGSTGPGSALFGSARPGLARLGFRVEKR